MAAACLCCTSNAQEDNWEVTRAPLAAELEFGDEVAIDENITGGRTWLNWVSLFAYIANTVVTFTSMTGIFGKTNTVLSAKYQTLVTPVGYAFSIWGVIFIGEGIWALRQMCDSFAGSPAVYLAHQGWWACCLFQVLWTIVFAQEIIWLALIMIVSILVSLVYIVVRIDTLQLSWSEYLAKRAPFALHLGWLVCASAVNANVLLDSQKAEPNTLYNAAVVTIVVVVLVSAAFATIPRTAEPLVPLVATWALVAIGKELSAPSKLNDPSRFNPHLWESSVLEGLTKKAFGAAFVCASLAIWALVLWSWDFRTFCCRRQGGRAAE